jgi:serine protease inhibitor
MNNKQQTAVEWLYDQMFLSPKSIIEYQNILEQAKAMEKEQIEQSYKDGWNAEDFGSDEWFINNLKCIIDLQIHLIKKGKQICIDRKEINKWVSDNGGGKL